MSGPEAACKNDVGFAVDRVVISGRSRKRVTFFFPWKLNSSSRTPRNRGTRSLLPTAFRSGFSVRRRSPPPPDPVCPRFGGRWAGGSSGREKTGGTFSKSNPPPGSFVVLATAPPGVFFYPGEVPRNPPVSSREPGTIRTKEQNR